MLIERVALIAQMQNKYDRGRRLRHSQLVWLWPVSARLLAEAHYTKDAERIGYLRADLLAEMLSRANVQQGMRLLVFDQVDGI